jgi:hypothetical protein
MAMEMLGYTLEEMKFLGSTQDWELLCDKLPFLVPHLGGTIIKERPVSLCRACDI